MQQRVIAAVISVCLLIIPVQSFAQACASWAAKLESLEGKATVKRTTTDQWQPVTAGATFCYGDTLRITEFRAALRLENDSLVRLQEGSVIKFLPPKQSFWAEIIEGAAHFISRTPKSFTVKAPYMNAAVEGTEFLVTHTSGRDTVAVFEGTVLASNDNGSTRLTGMQQSSAAPGATPSPAITIRLQDSANWTLHYPPVLIDAGSLPDSIRNASTADALNNLQATQYQNNLTAQNLLTSLALITGQAELAQRSNQQALTLDTNNADARALASLMQLVTGKPAAALKSATALTLQAEDAPNAWLVHSYALQAAFDIDAALASAQKAQQLAPQNPLATVRVAELALSQGNAQLATKTLGQGVDHPLYKPYADTLRALIALQNSDNRKAREILAASVKANPNVPITQFAQGLTLIRLNKLEEGRAKIELAVALDPSNSLYRSYLGKGYAAELRGDKAADQFALAKTLDPEDPTPWFYSALEQQSSNDLAGAIKSFEQSRALNDGRAVYRSRMLLDQDDAARSANLGRLYDAIGFEDQALEIGTRATEQAPDNYSAHRLLAQLYANDSEHEQLRASERLQATLLQPLGAQPLPLGLSETGMLVVDGAGPADLGISEYNSLYTSEGINAQANLLTGSRNTQAYDVNIGGMYENFSLNVGQYHYQTDGFRDNNDVEYTISNALAQWQVSDTFSLQAEVSRREDDQGDLGMRFDLSDFSENLRKHRETDTYRLSAVIDTYKYGQFIISASTKNKDSAIKNEVDYGFFVDTLDQIEDSDVDSLLGQYIYKLDNISFIAGIEKSTYDNRADFADSTPPAFNDESYIRSYTYLHSNTGILGGNLQTTLGLDFVDYDFNIDLGMGDGFTHIPQEESYLPSVGADWQLNHIVKINAAYFKTLAFNPDSSSSLAPNHVASFIKTFDLPPVSATENSAIKVTLTPLPSLTGGISYTSQSIELPTLNPTFTGIEIYKLLYDHPTTSAYINYLFNSKFALSVTASERTIDREKDPAYTNLAVPLNLRDRSYSTTLTYSINQTFGISLEGIMKSQKYKTEGAVGLQDAIDSTEDFYIGNADIEIRLPKRKGIFKLAVKNIFDSHFLYADFNIFTSEPRLQNLIPERSVYGSIILNY